MLTGWELNWDNPSPSSTQSSVDEEEVNCRIHPSWTKYRHLFERRGYRLETFRDVTEYYKQCIDDQSTHRPHSPGFSLGGDLDENALCPDPGLPDNLFRGIRARDGKQVMVKAVHIDSREFDIIRFLSTSPMREDPMNHCIPVLDLIEVSDDALGFIVMEAWSSQLVSVTPCCLRRFLAALRQCIEHAAYMHKYHIAHLDISLRNLLTDYKGHYAYIDYELSRRFDGIPNPRIHGCRGTEIPPEIERGEFSNPYKIDVWALAVLILRACKLTGYYIPELMHLVKPMLSENPDDRPTMQSVLKAFDCMMSTITDHRLQTSCPTS